MRLLYFLSVALGSIGAVEAAAGNKFQRFRTLAKPSIELDDSSFTDLTSKPRDYHVAVLLTAMEARYGCQVCRDFAPEWELLARSWNKLPPADTKVLFGTLDFARGRDTFQKLMLQTAPVMLFFPPTVGLGAKADSSPLRYDFTGLVSADNLNIWISRHVPNDPRPAISRPINYTRIVAYTTTLLGLVTFVTAASPYILPVIRSRALWAAVSLVLVLLFTSGYMFNHIRKVPYIAGDGKGGVAYFAPGFSSQYGLESQIIAAIYGVLSFATIAIAMKTPRIVDAKAQQASVIIWAGVILLMYSFLLSSFRTKNSGYPFYLPPF